MSWMNQQITSNFDMNFEICVDYILFEIDQEGKSSRKLLFGSSVVSEDWGFTTFVKTASGSAIQFLAPFVLNLSIRF